MKNSLNLFTFSLLGIFFTFFACQQKVVIPKISNNSITHTVHFENDNRNNIFVSRKIKIQPTTPTPFIMLSGYVETEDFKGQFSYRTQVNEKWTEWKPFLLNHEGYTANRTVFIGGELSNITKLLQIKSEQPIDLPFQLRLYAPGHSKKKDNAITRNEESACTCLQPPTLDRIGWCPNGDCPIDNTPVSTVPSHIIVHHSAGQTNSSDFAAVVRSYWDFHVNTNGWDDIGYNWLVDPNGVIYEGRGEGLQGAHFSCMNEKTTSICFIGNYEIATPASDGILSLQDFLAWAACSNDIDAAGSSLHQSSQLTLNHISGHLDGNDSPNACSSTVCPGVNLYSLFPTIISDVAAYPCLQDNPVNVNTLLDTENIDIFPNPSTGPFQVKWENVSVNNIIIYNSIGQEVRRFNNLKNKNLQEIELNIKGAYFLKIRLEDNRVIEQKLVIS